MKTILLALTLLSSILGYAQNVYIPDPLFKNFLVNAGVDSNADGEIQYTEAQAINGQMSCFYCGFTDLTGIEAFTSITWLSIIGNLLTELDVSQNTELTYLRCDKNQITNLDLSQNSDLKMLNCSDNQLTTLIFPQNSILDDIRCHNNQITELDLSQQSALKIIYAFNNKLTSLDASGASEVATLLLWSNLLDSINVNQNSELANLLCDKNKLTSIDVSQNSKLITLDCDHNQLTSLDISKNPKLWRLHCDSNELSCLNVKNGNNKSLDLFASGNPHLFCIEVDNVSWSQSNWSDIDPHTSYTTYCWNYCSDGPPPETVPKYLIKVVDILGRETKIKSNMVLIYIYSDGTNEKVFIME